MPAEHSYISAEAALRSTDTRLVDVVDNLLAHGVVIRGEAWISVAEVDLLVLGLDLILTNPETLTADRIAS